MLVRTSSSSSLSVSSLSSHEKSDASSEDFILPEGFFPYEEFNAKFALGSASTEKRHTSTMTLSRTMHEDVEWGLSHLAGVDMVVLQGLAEFKKIVAKDNIDETLAIKLLQGGRIFLIGSGSSGRVAVDVAAKCLGTFPAMKGRIYGFLAGGDSAFIRAREGFEDSELDGEKALQTYDLSANDVVVLISASGSAPFNVGCGHFAANRGASVYYFYNNHNVPERTEKLFQRENNKVKSICIDTGAQAIAGSTRLQAATLAEVCLGGLLASSIFLHNQQDDKGQGFLHELGMKCFQLNSLIPSFFPKIAQLIEAEVEVFLDPQSNFRRLQDKSERGYITFLASQNSIREVLIDATETSPTFSTNPIKRESDQNGKRSEFRAYLIGEMSNFEAWKSLVGREVFSEDAVEQFLLSAQADGRYSLANRPKGKGNLVIGVCKLDSDQAVVPSYLENHLKEVKELGGKTGLILLVTDKLEEEKKQALESLADIAVVVDEVPSDPMGICQTVLLKQILNLISNGSMTLMNKVHGNRMIDLRASNSKLIDRCMRLITEIVGEERPDISIDQKTLYYDFASVFKKRKEAEAEGRYTPSIVKILIVMLLQGKKPNDFEDIVNILLENGERINFTS